MAFLVVLALAELLLGLLTITIGALIAGLERAFITAQEKSRRQRADREQQTAPEYTEQLRDIRHSCEQIEADIYLQNQLHHWNSMNHH